MRARTPSNKVFHLLLAGAFIFNLISPSFAQEVDLKLPKPSQIKPISKPFAPAIIRAVTVNPKDPFLFDFIIDKGDSNLDAEAFEDETQKLVKYFLAALTIPENDLWVNLSPYEQDSMVPRVLGVTELGKDLLIEDYYLKQVTASLTNPNTETGKKFWSLAYAKAQELYGTTKVPINTFSKVWIVPDQAVVLEKDGSAFIADSHLKVYLDQDYVAIKKNLDNKEIGTDKIGSDKAQDINGFSAQIIKEVVLPEIEKEVNTGENFASVRQIYSSAILAAWYKKRLKESLLGRLYADQNKVAGVNAEDMDSGDKIFEKYTAALKTGAYNIIKQDFDLSTQKIVQRKYFSGGATFAGLGNKITFQQAATAAGQAFSAPTPAAVQSALAFSKSVTAFSDGQNTAGASAKPGSFEAGNYQYTKVSVRVASAATTTAESVNEKINIGVASSGLTDAIKAVAVALARKSAGEVSRVSEISEMNRAGAFLSGILSETEQTQVNSIVLTASERTKETPEIQALAPEQKVAAVKTLAGILNKPGASTKRAEVAAALNVFVKTGKLSGPQAIYAVNMIEPSAAAFVGKLNTLAAFANPGVSQETLVGALSAGSVANAPQIASEIIALRTAQPLNTTESFTAQIAKSNFELAEQLNTLAGNAQVQTALASYSPSVEAKSSPQMVQEAKLEIIAGNIYAAYIASPKEKQEELKTSLGVKEISRETIKVWVSQASGIDITGNAKQIATVAKEKSRQLYTLFQKSPSIKNAFLADAGSASASSAATPVQNILSAVKGIDSPAAIANIAGDDQVLKHFTEIANKTNRPEGTKFNPQALTQTIRAVVYQATVDPLFNQEVSSARNVQDLQTAVKKQAAINPEFAKYVSQKDIDNLSNADVRKVGGIDLSAERMDLKIKRDGNGVVLPVSDQDMENLKIDGLSPVILDVQPATPASVPFLMNLANTAAQTK